MIEQAWRQPHAGRIVLVQAPVSVLAGWLMAATAISTGTMLLALTVEPSVRCPRRASYWTCNRETYENSWSFASYVPITLSMVVSTLAVLTPDPLLPLPLAWAIINMKGHVKNWAAIGLLVSVSVLMFVQWLREFA